MESNGPDSISACENCGARLHGRYCHACGQSVETSFRFFGSMLMDLLGNLFSYDSRVNRTLIPLLLRPGDVCERYLSGQRARFLPPFRLYLFASVIFFLAAQQLAVVEVDISDHDTEQKQGVIDRAETQPGEEDRTAKVLVRDDGLRTIEQPEAAAEGARSIGVTLPFFTAEQNEELSTKIEEVLENRPQDLVRATVRSLPTIIFLLLPLFALFLKLFYIFSGRYYMEHVIVVLFIQSFLFLALLLAMLVDKGEQLLSEHYPELALIGVSLYVIAKALYFWIPVYLYLMQKRVYGQDWILTTVKFGLVSMTYLTLTLFAMVFAIVWNVVTL